MALPPTVLGYAKGLLSGQRKEAGLDVTFSQTPLEICLNQRSVKEVSNIAVPLVDVALTLVSGVVTQGLTPELNFIAAFEYRNDRQRRPQLDPMGLLLPLFTGKELVFATLLDSDSGVSIV